MPEPAAPLVAVGVDGAPAGWAAACLYADARDREHATSWETRLYLVGDIEELVALRDAAGSRAPVAIDVPIGLPATVGYRRCDEEARHRLRSGNRTHDRSGSVFMPPARYMLDVADDYPAIRRLVETERASNPAARGLSAQAAGIAPKVAEVDAWVRAHRDSEAWLCECHPELSFWALNDSAPMPYPKTAPAGVVQRLRLARGRFPDADEQLAAAPWMSKRVGLSDLLDAYAALSTALKCVRGDQDELGDGERDGEGLLMRMAL